MATTVKRIRELGTAATVTDDHYVVLDSDSGATEKTKVASINAKARGAVLHVETQEEAAALTVVASTIKVIEASSFGGAQLAFPRRFKRVGAEPAVPSTEKFSTGAQWWQIMPALATSGETVTGTDDVKGTHSAGVKAAIGAAIEPFKTHPLSGSATVIYRDGLTHTWAGPQWIGIDGVRRFVKHDGWRHEGSIGSGVQVYQSYDGRQVRNPNTAFSLSDRAPAEVVGGRMGGTRTGLIVTALDASSNTLNYFVSSDDDSFEWGAPTLLTTIAPIFTYGKFHNIPNVDTTPSTNDWIAFGYGAGHIYWISTANNGTTWTSGDCFGGALAGFLGVEAYVERFPGQNKWVMIIRDDTGGNARMSVTTDLKNWPAPVATSLPTGANPLTLIFHGGRLYIYATARRGQPINGATDALVYWAVDPAVVEATSAVGSPTMKLAYAGSTHMLGYLNTVMTPNGYWEASFTSDETELGSANPSASHVVMLSGVQTEVASPAIIATRPNKNLWDNGTLQSVTRAASGSLSDGVIVADRLKWFGAATGTYARQDVPYDIARTMPHKPRKMTTIVSSATTNCGFSMRRYGADHFRMAADAVLTISVHAANTWPNPLFFKVIHRTAKTAGTDIPSPAVQLTGDPKPNGGWFASVTYPTIGMSGVSLGADPSVEYQLYTPLAGGGYDGSICGVKLEFGDTATALEQDDGDMPEHLSRTAEMVTFAPGHVIGAVYPLASGSGGCVLEYEPKDFAPSVTITASSLIVVTAGGSVAVTGLTVAAGTTPGQRRCVLTVTAPGLTQPGALMVDAGGSASFLVSVDH